MATAGFPFQLGSIQLSERMWNKQKRPRNKLYNLEILQEIWGLTNCWLFPVLSGLLFWLLFPVSGVGCGQSESFCIQRSAGLSRMLYKAFTVGMLHFIAPWVTKYVADRQNRVLLLSEMFCPNILVDKSLVRVQRDCGCSTFAYCLLYKHLLLLPYSLHERWSALL